MASDDHRGVFNQAQNVADAKKSEDDA